MQGFPCLGGAAPFWNTSLRDAAKGKLTHGSWRGVNILFKFELIGENNLFLTLIEEDSGKEKVVTKAASQKEVVWHRIQIL